MRVGCKDQPQTDACIVTGHCAVPARNGAAERSMRISRRRSILGQESFIPEWAIPILVTLGICLLVLIVLIPVAVVRTQRGRAASQNGGIQVEGVRASKSLKLLISPDSLRERIRAIVNSEWRFSRAEETLDGVDVFVRGNIWTWGEVIEVRFTETTSGTEVIATCRPRVSTTLFDYGQSGSDLSLFVDLLVRQRESGHRG
jgi:hypothetical protein